jgi:hypothetical protein
MMLLIWPVVLLAVARLEPSANRRQLIFAVATLGLVYPLAWLGGHAADVVTNYGSISAMQTADAAVGGRWNEAVYDWNRAQGLPVVAVLPSNTFLVGTVEDMAMRGCHDMFLGHWYDPVGPTCARLFPELTFASYTVPQDLPEHLVVMWTEPMAGASTLVSPAEEQHLRQVLVEDGFDRLVADGRCQTWPQEQAAMLIRSCVR